MVTENTIENQDNAAIKHCVTTHKRDVRIRLTSRCNYKCFFCHEEGGCRLQADPTFEDMRPLLEQLYSQGHRDFTFTGGEPLMNKHALLGSLRWFAALPGNSQITLITNGSLMDDSVEEALVACPSARVHLSLHATDPLLYCKITGQNKIVPEMLVERFKRLTRRGVALKVSTVLQRDLIEDGSRLTGLINFARRTGASHLKLIELLVTNDHPELLDHYLSAKEAELFLRRYATLSSANARTRVYRLKKSRALIELTCCVCTLGCAACKLFRAELFTGGSTYQPCFLCPDTTPVTPESLSTVLKNGTEYIRKMGERYGKCAPSLITASAYVDEDWD